MSGIQIVKRTKSPQRWLSPLHGGNAVATTNQAFGTAGRLYFYLFEVTEPCVVDQIVIVNGTTVAGSVIVGIYGPLVTEESPTGAPLVTQSASTVQVNTSTPQAFSVTSTLLMPGRYYFVIEGSDATGTIMRNGQTNQVSGFCGLFDRVGGYGVLADPCPTVSNLTAGISPTFKIRCKNVIL